MNLHDLCITREGLLIYNNNRVGNEYRITIPGMVHKGEMLILKIKNLMCLMNIDYDVEITPLGISRFISRNKKYNLTYFIALEGSSNDE